MADAFISYRRQPSASLALLIQEKLKNQHKVDCYVDVTRADSSQVQFPERLMQAIDNAPVFICLLGDSTLDSEWVLKEIRKAHELKKFCIPVFQESYKAPQNPEKAVQYLLNFDGVHVFDRKNIYIDTAVRDIGNLIPRKKSSILNYSSLVVLIGTVLIIGIAFITWSLTNSPTQKATSTPELDGDNIQVSDTSQATSTTATDNIIPTEVKITETATPTEPEPSLMETFLEDIRRLQDTGNVNAIVECGEFNQIYDSLSEYDIEQNLILASFVREIQFSSIVINTSCITNNDTTQFAFSDYLDWDQDISELVDEIEYYLDVSYLAIEGVSSNEEWTPYMQEFDSVEMMLVPSGCFMMGSTNEQLNLLFSLGVNLENMSFEQPAHERCLRHPIWIDRYEVSNSQFEQFGGSTENNRLSYWQDGELPRESINFQEAQNFCAIRDARLPEEYEWEYAARGVENLLTPWGNTIPNNENANFCDINCTSEWANTNIDDGYQNTSPVEEFLASESWVGSLNMIGNVWEWTNTPIFDYPYDEDTMQLSADIYTLRGGSWINPLVSATYRGFRVSSANVVNVVGFRCVRDFDIEEHQ